MNFAGHFISAVFSLIFVIGLILLTAWVFRWMQKNRGSLIKKSMPASRLEIVQTLPIDLKRRLLLIRRDDTLHLLLCGEGQDIVIETQIPLEHAPIITAPTDETN